MIKPGIFSYIFLYLFVNRFHSVIIPSPDTNKTWFSSLLYIAQFNHEPHFFEVFMLFWFFMFHFLTVPSLEAERTTFPLALYIALFTQSECPLYTIHSRCSNCAPVRTFHSLHCFVVGCRQYLLPVRTIYGTVYTAFMTDVLVKYFP